MRKKTSDLRMSFVPTEKNRVYLETLGVIDGRTGKTRKDGPVLNKLMNDVLTIVLESDKSPRKEISSPEELRRAWIKHLVKVKNGQMIDLEKDLRKLAELLPRDREIVILEQEMFQ